MNGLTLSRFLGWFSLGIGTMEVLAPRALSRTLVLSGESWIIRAFGVREIAVGLTVLAKPEQPTGPVLRVAGDVLDLAVLAPALSPRNGHRSAAQLAFATVLAVTAVDVFCASALISGERRRAATSHRARLRKPPAARLPTPQRKPRSSRKKPHSLAGASVDHGKSAPAKSSG